MFLLFQASPEIKGNTYSQIVLLFYIPFLFLVIIVINFLYLLRHLSMIRYLLIHQVLSSLFQMLFCSLVSEGNM